ncbi:hypothetical protein JXB22_11520 [candidate division WOR-3 bacterium]|nr:hypothetical protein [candidate division WOR-3 bacterium]
MIGGDGGQKFEDLANEGVSLLNDICYDTFALKWNYDSSAFQENIDTLLQMGQLITAYYDHGDPYGWPGHSNNGYLIRYSVCSPDSLTNADSQGVIISYACETAMFQRDHPYYDTIPCSYWAYDTCFGESFLYNPNGGAIAFYGGASIINLGRFSSEATRRMLQGQDWILGKMFVNVPGAGNSKKDCFCLLGDPALDLGDYTAFPDLPDLVVRPRGLDITLPHPFPYCNSGDTIPIEAVVYNIGGDTAFNFDVAFDVVTQDDDTIFKTSREIDTLLPRDTALIEVRWRTDSTHANYVGEIGNCDFYVTADPDSEITESWEGNNSSSILRKIALYPYQSGWPKLMYRFPGQPALGNLDDSAAVEIVCPCGDSIFVHNYEGEVMSGWPKYLGDVKSVVLADLDCMGDLEIIASSTDTVTVFDYQGNMVSGWPKTVPHADSLMFFGMPSVGYIEGSDKRQVILGLCKTSMSPYGVTKGALVVYDYDGDSLYYLTHDSLYANLLLHAKGISVSDVNNDGDEEMLISYEYYRTDESGIKDSCFTDIFNKDGHVRTLGFGSHTSIPALVDLDYPFGDGIPEMVVADKFDTIRAYKGRTQTTLWKTATAGPIMVSPAVGDIKPTLFGHPSEIAFGNDSMEIWAVDYQGHQWSPYPFDVQKAVQTSPALAKLSGEADTYADIVIGSNAQYIYGYQNDGDSLSPYPLPVFGTQWSAPVIGDIDGDRISETVIATNDKYLHVWNNVNSHVLPQYLLEWPQYHHDYQRTGLYNWTGGFGGGGDGEEFSNFITLTLTIRDTCYMEVTIYDSTGKTVKNLVAQELSPGKYHPVWYGKDNNYNLLANGLYYIILQARGEQKVLPVRIKR